MKCMCFLFKSPRQIFTDNDDDDGVLNQNAADVDLQETQHVSTVDLAWFCTDATSNSQRSDYTRTHTYTCIHTHSTSTNY